LEDFILIEEIKNIVSLYEQNNIDLAELKIINLIKKDSNNDFLYNIYGLILLKKERLTEAEESFKKAIKLNPNYIEALNNLGIVLKDLKKNDEALKIYDQAINLDHNFSILHNNKGIVLKNMEKYKESILSYKTAVIQDPNYYDAYNNMGITYDKLNDLDLAILSFKKAILINKNYVEAYNNLASVYAKKKEYLNAIEIYKKALELRPLYEDAAHNLGHTYYLIENLEEAISYVKLSLKADPAFADAWNTLGMIYYKMGKLDLAKKNYLKSIELNQKLYKARYNLGVLMIRSGEYETGWIERETKRIDEIDLIRNNLSKLWDGKYVDGTLYIWREQGLGDEVSFSSNLILLSKMAKEVIVEVDIRIQFLISRFLENKNIKNMKVIGSNKDSSDSIQKNIVRYKKHFSLGSLGIYLLNSKEKFLSVEFPYLIPDSKKNIFINLKTDNKKYKVGISWKTGNLLELHRSINLEEFKDIFNIENIDFYSLQFGECKSEILSIKNKFNKEIKIIDEIDYKNDIESVASLISELDLVITIQNAVAHISCALGKETWVLVPLFCRNNWGVNGRSCDWYKTAVIYRQEKAFFWDLVLSNVYLDLSERAKNNTNYGIPIS
jgi:tetratricopeptide (TPR) repeat protein